MNAMICAVLASSWYKKTLKIVLVTSLLNTNRLLPGSSDFMTILNMLLILGKYNMALICQIKTEDLYFSIQCNQSTE